MFVLREVYESLRVGGLGPDRLTQDSILGQWSLSWTAIAQLDCRTVAGRHVAVVASPGPSRFARALVGLSLARVDCSLQTLGISAVGEGCYAASKTGVLPVCSN